MRRRGTPTFVEVVVVVAAALATLAAWAPYPAGDGDGVDFGAIAVGLLVGLWLSLRVTSAGTAARSDHPSVDRAAAVR